MRRVGGAERATVGPSADRHSAELSRKLGKALREARVRAGLTQAETAAKAGLSQGALSRLERDADPRYTLATWDRAAFAVGTSLHAFLPEASAADLPRDVVHLRNQELILRTAKDGGWAGVPEEPIDRDVGRSRWADVVLGRRRPAGQDEDGPGEYALMEVIDWFDDVGAPMREWQRRLDALERYAIARMHGDEAAPRIGGCWVVRATRRNRDLVTNHPTMFRSRFPGSGRAWLAALTRRETEMPRESALLWVSVNGERLYASRFA